MFKTFIIMLNFLKDGMNRTGTVDITGFNLMGIIVKMNIDYDMRHFSKID
ncbi:hypothetical protein psyc5s11_13000 [Clostridium gelidum]|uniref:Uncharacterized protein n=1 Tax=Clostridium gelidum TaxID=704125 RepID=A0ABN6IWF8_9CLOT|nr:hypothetical protein psyc5s11_13000 [Clostridium gelidum]